MARRLRISSLLIAAGLLVQIASMMILHPLSFVSFLAIRCPLIGTGVIYFLLGLVSGSPRPEEVIRIHNPSD
jgi:hypothetical protein